MQKVPTVVCAAQGGVTLTKMVSHAMPNHREIPLEPAPFYQAILHVVLAYAILGLQFAPINCSGDC